MDYITLRKKLGDWISLEDIFEIIKYCTNSNSESLFIINIDETNKLSYHEMSYWLSNVLLSIKRLIIKNYFIFVTLTGTDANGLRNALKLSYLNSQYIHLRFLKPDHAEDVILELGNRGVGSKILIF